VSQSVICGSGPSASSGLSWKWRKRSSVKITERPHEETTEALHAYTPKEKVAILRRHLVEGAPISDLCDTLGLQPTVFYRWQKEFFENGAAAFKQKGRPDHSAEQERFAHPEWKIQTRDVVLAKLMFSASANMTGLSSLIPPRRHSDRGRYAPLRWPPFG
jgi:transposase